MAMAIVYVHKSFAQNENTVMVGGVEMYPSKNINRLCLLIIFIQ